MSIINQMLRDLDARGAAPADRPEPSAPGQEPQKRRPAARLPAMIGLLAAGAAVLYWMWPHAPGKEATPIDFVSPLQPAASAPAAGRAPQLRPEPAEAGAAMQPVRPDPEAVRGRPNPLALSPSLAVGAAPAPSEPAIVKNMAELSPEAEAQQLYDDALALRRAGKPDAAMGKLRQALERNPGMAHARIQLARTLQEGGQADAALALLKAGYEQRADEMLAIAAGRLLSDLGQRDEALVWLARGQAGLRPGDHALMGALLSQASRHEEASRAYQRALAADPGQGGWLLGLGLALEAQGRTEEAQTVYRNALERGQFKPEVMRFLRERSGFSEP